MILLLQTPLSNENLNAILQADLVKILALVLVIFGVGYFFMVSLSLRNAGAADKRARDSDARADKNLELLIQVNEKSHDTHATIATAFAKLSEAIDKQTTVMDVVSRRESDRITLLDDTVSRLADHTERLSAVVDSRLQSITDELKSVRAVVEKLPGGNEVLEGKLDLALSLLKVEKRGTQETKAVVNGEKPIGAETDKGLS